MKRRRARSSSDISSRRRDKYGRAIPSGTSGSQDPTEEPNFKATGLLYASESSLQASQNIKLKYVEPSNAVKPSTAQWRLYVFKEEEFITKYHLYRQSCFRIGRQEECNQIITAHASCSKQHAVIQFRKQPNSERFQIEAVPYLMDLQSTHGTFLNDEKIHQQRYYQLLPNDIVKFGASTREYIVIKDELQQEKD